MKRIVLTSFGGPDVLELREEATPELPADGLRIAVKAVGVNFADVVMRLGLYPEAPKPPSTPGYEIAGEVVEVGAAVLPGRFAKGDRVLASTRFGGYASEVCVSAVQARKIPDTMKFEDAASIPVNWGTAWIALQDMARVRKGDRVLVHSAAGGVGVAAVQIAAAAGATVVGLTGSPAKAQAIRDLGATDVWTNEEWASSARASERFDIVVEAIGGAELKRCFARLAPTGRVVTFGVSAMVGGERRSILRVAKTMVSMPLFTPVKLMMSNKGVFGLNMLKLLSDPGQIGRMGAAIDAVVEGVREKRYRTVVSKTFPLAEAGAAQEFLRGRGAVGKVVLIP